MPGSKKITIFYHHPCLDGDMSMYIAYKVLGDKAKYVPLNHGGDMVRKITGETDQSSEVYFVDIAPDKETLMFLLAEGKKVTVLDHHITAIEEIEKIVHKNLTMLLDKSKKYSGAGLAWQHFVITPGKKISNHENIGEIIREVQLIDLHRVDEPDFFALANYFDLSASLAGEGIIERFDRIASVPVKDKIKFGESMTELLRNTQDDAFKSAEVAVISNTGSRFDGIEVLLISANLQKMGREFFPRIIKNFPGFAVVGAWYKDDRDTYRLSLRRSDDSINIAKLAKALAKRGEGGGGHEESAAVQFNRAQFKTTLPVDPEKTRKLKTKKKN